MSYYCICRLYALVSLFMYIINIIIAINWRPNINLLRYNVYSDPSLKTSCNVSTIGTIMKK